MVRRQARASCAGAGRRPCRHRSQGRRRRAARFGHDGAIRSRRLPVDRAHAAEERAVDGRRLEIQGRSARRACLRSRHREAFVISRPARQRAMTGEETKMLKRRDMLAGATAVAATTALPRRIYAQTGTKKLSLLTWNIIDMEPLFKQWFATFQSQNPGVEIEWLDKKGPELPAFYQTQLAAGTPPDIIDIQGALGLEWASQGALMDMTPLLDKEAAVKNRFDPAYLANWVFEGKNYLIPFYVAKTLLFYNKPMFKAAGIDYAPKSLDDILAYAKAMSGGDRTGFLTLNFDWLYWPLFKMQGVDLLTADLKKPTFNTPAGIETADKLAKATA